MEFCHGAGHFFRHQPCRAQLASFPMKLGLLALCLASAEAFRLPPLPEMPQASHKLVRVAAAQYVAAGTMTAQTHALGLTLPGVEAVEQQLTFSSGDSVTFVLFASAFALGYALSSWPPLQRS